MSTIFGGSRLGRIRLIRQTEISECGLASLTMIANFHGMSVDLGSMRRRFAISMRGASLRNLIDIADQIGLGARAVGLALEDLDKLHLPAILHWNLNHFVVIEAVRGDRVLIHDPDGRSAWLPLSEVSDSFTGYALELRRTIAFTPRDERQHLRLRQLWERMQGLGTTLVQALLLTLILQLYVLVSPYYMQVAIDRVLPAFDANLLTVLAIGFGLFTVINAGAALLRAYVLLNAGAAVGFGITVNIVRRLFRLPIAWFERRQTGDILSRFQSVGPIQQILTEGAVASMVDGMLAILTLTVMAIYNVTLALIAVGALLSYGLIRAALFRMQRDAQEASIAAAAKEQTMLIESLRGMTTLRLFGQETLRHALWQSRRADAVNADVRLARIAAWHGIINVLIFGLENVLSIWLAVNLVMQGGTFSLGMLFAYFAYKQQFLQKSEGLIDQFVQLRMLGLHLERLSDIALADEDASFAPQPALTGQLRGEIEIRDLHFRYSDADPPVLKGLSLKVSPGEHVAITGPSGGGKSTLVKILLGLLEPQQGTLLIDGVELRQYGLRNFHQQIAGVLQEDSLFAGSLAENIALFDPQLDVQRVEESARLAAIHDEIQDLPMGYDTLVGEMGSTLSGGQKQRVLLARALYRKPRLLVMDEGTAHLDKDCEAAVNAALKGLGITRIIVAHRKETIAAADRIVRLEQGQLS